jgi:hypothetical protein
MGLRCERDWRWLRTQSIAARAGHAPHRAMHSLTHRMASTRCAANPPGPYGNPVRHLARVRSDCAYHRHALVVDTNVQHTPSSLPHGAPASSRCVAPGYSVCARLPPHSCSPTFHRGGSEGTRRHRGLPHSASGEKNHRARTFYALRCGGSQKQRSAEVCAPHPGPSDGGGLQGESELAFTVSEADGGV